MSIIKNILILTYWSYRDPLIQTYTLPYVHIIKNNLNSKSKIYLFTLEQEFHKMSSKEWESEKIKLEKDNIHLIKFNYSRLGIKMILKLIYFFFSLYKLILFKNVSTIHAWGNAAGAMGYILSILSGKELIIDSYEPHAESMVENGTWDKTGWRFKLMFWLEKKQSKKANTVIALTEGMKDYALRKYNANFKNYYVKPSLVDLQRFKKDVEKYTTSRLERSLNSKIIGVYAGKIGGIYLEEELFDFIKIATEHWKNNFQMFILTDTKKEIINTYIQQKNIPKQCISSTFVNHSEIQEYLNLADFAINPVKPVPSKRYCTSIKDGEYWAMSLPIIITKNISDDSEIIDKNNIGYVLNELNDSEYIKACKKIDLLISNKEETEKKVRNIAETYRNFEIALNIYKKIYYQK